jgi:hypothetical protein
MLSDVASTSGMASWTLTVCAADSDVDEPSLMTETSASTVEDNSGSDTLLTGTPSKEARLVALTLGTVKAAVAEVLISCAAKNWMETGASPDCNFRCEPS